MATDTGLADRLDTVFGRMDNRTVAEVLRDKAGYETSYETVRRYRKGVSQTVGADFLLAVVTAFGCDAGWLLTGEGSPEGQNGQGRRLADLPPISARERERLIRLLQSSLGPLALALEDLEEGMRELTDHQRREIAQSLMEEELARQQDAHRRSG